MSELLMANFSNTSNLDDELAQMTDKLLAGQDAEVNLDNAMQARIVAQLNAAVAAGHGPDAAFKSQLTRRLNEEWDHVFQPKPARFAGRRLMGFGALAAGVVIVLGVILALLASGSAGGPLNTTALGPTGPGLLALLLIGGALAAALVYWRKR